MLTRAPRRLVIDPSVARAAGGTEATFPTSMHCRDFLETVEVTSHHVVMTPDIFAEWKAHQTGPAFIWQRTMVAKKRIVFLKITPNARLRRKIENASASERDREAMLKDIHLVEAALETDRTVISLDETARKLFASTSMGVHELRTVVWVNPDKTEECAVLWLENGAKPERKRQLGFRVGESR